jgi:hypothetical protein
MAVEATANDMLMVGLNCIGFTPQRNENTNSEHFVSAFGVDPNVASIVFF